MRIDITVWDNGTSSTERFDTDDAASAFIRGKMEPGTNIDTPAMVVRDAIEFWIETTMEVEP